MAAPETEPSKRISTSLFLLDRFLFRTIPKPYCWIEACTSPSQPHCHVLWAQAFQVRTLTWLPFVIPVFKLFFSFVWSCLLSAMLSGTKFYFLIILPLEIAALDDHPLPCPLLLCTDGLALPTFAMLSLPWRTALGWNICTNFLTSLSSSSRWDPLIPKLL